MQTWLLAFIDEKGIDREDTVTVDGPSGPNVIPIGCIVDAILRAPATEQRAIKDTIVKIDFHNGNVMHFFRHLAKTISL